jgi:hypothetical protein
MSKPKRIYNNPTIVSFLENECSKMISGDEKSYFIPFVFKQIKKGCWELVHLDDVSREEAGLFDNIKWFKKIKNEK